MSEPITTIKWGLSLRWGIIVYRTTDTPNEADLLIVDEWGFGYSQFFHTWLLWPFKSVHEVV